MTPDVEGKRKRTTNRPPRAEMLPPQIPALEARAFEVSSELVKKQVEEAIGVLMHDFVPMVKWRIEDRLDRAITEVKQLAEPLGAQLSERIAEVDLLLRSTSREGRLSAEEITVLRQTLGDEMSKLGTDVTSAVSRLETAAQTLTKERRASDFDPLKLERTTFWQLMAAAFLGALAVVAGHAVANNRHDHVVREALGNYAW